MALPLNTPYAPELEPPFAPPVGDGEVLVWRITLDDLDGSWQDALALLDDHERWRADRLQGWRDRQRFVVAHAALRAILGRSLAIHPAEVRFAGGPGAKPSLEGAAGDGLRFNLSHSYQLAVVALARRRDVGVDIERLRQSLPHEAIAAEFFSLAERAALAALPPGQRTRAFYRCWTRKEAFVKARGLGLRAPLGSFDVTLAPGEPARLLACREAGVDAGAWSLDDLDLPPGYVGAVAASGQDWRVRCLSWSWPSAAAK